MTNRRNIVLAVVAMVLIALGGPLGDRVSGMTDSIWSVIAAWIIIIAAWAFIGPKLWRQWRNSRT